MRRAIKAVLVDVGIVLAAIAVAFVIVVWAILRGAHADRGRPHIPTPVESMPTIQRCVVTSLTVDGLPVLQHGWCAWDNDQRLWVPMGKDLARRRVIDIIPLED